MAPGENGIVDDEIFEDERMWFDSKELGGGDEALGADSLCVRFLLFSNQ